MSMTNKDFRARARIGTQLAVAAAAAALLSAPEVRAQTVYNVAGIADVRMIASVPSVSQWADK